MEILMISRDYCARILDKGNVVAVPSGRFADSTINKRYLLNPSRH